MPGCSICGAPIPEGGMHVHMAWHAQIQTYLEELASQANSNINREDDPDEIGYIFIVDGSV